MILFAADDEFLPIQLALKVCIYIYIVDKLSKSKSVAKDTPCPKKLPYLVGIKSQGRQSSTHLSSNSIPRLLISLNSALDLARF